MQKGIRDGCFGNSISLAEKFRIGKQAGFAGMELTLPEDGEYSLNAADSKLKELNSLAKQHGLVLHAMGAGLPWAYPLTAPDKEARAIGMRSMERSIDIAGLLGVDSLLVITARVEPGVGYRQAWDVSMAALKKLAVRAEAKGVHLLIENVWNNFLLSPLEMRHYIDEAESDYVGSYFDCGNVMAFGYPEDWIEVLGSRIGKIHIKDFIARRQNRDGFCGLLEGDVNWKAVMSTLKQIGYDGWATIEVNAYASYPEAGVAELSRQLDVILAEYR